MSSIAKTWPPAGAALARRDQRIVGDLNAVELHIVCGGVERVLEFDNPQICGAEGGLGAIELLPLIHYFLGLKSFLHQIGGAIVFLLSKQRLRLLLLHIGFRFLDRAACLLDLRLRLFQRSGKILRIHAGDDLAALDEIAFVGKQLGDPPGIFGVDVDGIRLEPAVAVGNTGQQLRAHVLPPVISAAAAG